jgi:putative transcriptional regulator
MFAENKLSPRAGRLLIAEPFLHDGFFKRAVVLLAEHSEKGSVGFILNKPLDVLVHEAVPDFPHYHSLTLFGGPVQRDQLYYIHTLGDKIEGSAPIAKDLWWLGDFEQIKELIAKKEIRPDQLRFFIGYAGWEAGQLDKELEEKSWFVSHPDKELIFSHAPDEMWASAVKNMGSDFAPMANFPEDPSLN